MCSRAIVILLFNYVVWCYATGSNNDEARVVIRNSTLHKFDTPYGIQYCLKDWYEVKINNSLFVELVNIVNTSTNLTCYALHDNTPKISVKKHLSNVPTVSKFKIDKVSKGDTWVCSTTPKYFIFYLNIRVIGVSVFGHWSSLSYSQWIQDNYVIREPTNLYSNTSFQDGEQINITCDSNNRICTVLNPRIKGYQFLARQGCGNLAPKYTPYLKKVYLYNQTEFLCYRDIQVVLELSCSYCGSPNPSQENKLNCLAREIIWRGRKFTKNKVIKVVINKMVPVSTDPSTTQLTSPNTITTDSPMAKDMNTYVAEPTLGATTEPNNNEWIFAAVIVPILIVGICIITVIYKRNKRNHITNSSNQQHNQENEYDYCSSDFITQSQPETEYVYLVPEGEKSGKVHYSSCGVNDKPQSTVNYTEAQVHVKYDPKTEGHYSNLHNVNSIPENFTKIEETNICDLDINKLYARPIPRKSRKDKKKTMNENLTVITESHTDEYQIPHDIIDTKDNDTYANVTDGPLYSNKIREYCDDPTYSEPNTKKQVVKL